jgi:hypothetical protein
MTDQKLTDNPGNAQNPSIAKTLIIAIVILAVALGIGMLVRKFKTDSSEIEPVAQIDEEQNIDTPDESPEIVYTIPPVIKELPEPVTEVAVEPEPEPEPVPAYEVPVQNERPYTLTEQQRQDASQWMSWLGTLTQEERTQLFQGSIMAFMQVMQRWQYMPPEQAMEERTFLRELIQGWQNLPQEERQQGIENIQNQLQQWLQSSQQY